MKRVECDVDYGEVQNEDGRWVDGVVVTCPICRNQEEAYGQGVNSIKRALVMLRETCPKKARNFYVGID